MEIFRINKSDIIECTNSARKVSSLTGMSFIYHWLDCLYCIVRHGCSPTQYLEGGFYKLRSFDRRKTYTKGRGYKLKRELNNPKFVGICSSKVEFNKFFSIYLGRKWVYCKDVSVRNLLSFISNNERILVKPSNLTKGLGIYELNKKQSDEALIKELTGKDYLLEEYIVQHPKMFFGNCSVNTLRINTVLDAYGEVHIIKVCLRVGVGNTVVDNFSAGGIAYPVSIKYGRIEGPGRNKDKEENFFVHPGSNIYMIGVEIPYWDQVIDMVTKASKLLPQVRFIGWDVAITVNGPVLIECNTRPGAFLMEYIGIEKGLYEIIKSYK